MTAGRSLFAERGYADVGTDELARAAGVTRGALYHQFDGKAGLFSAVLAEVEQEVRDRVSAAMEPVDDPARRLLAGLDAYLDACADPVVHRIALVEAPAALGWQAWRDVGHAYAVGLVEEAVAALAPGGTPVRALAHVLVGALGEAALYAVAGGAGEDGGAGDATAARAEARAAVTTLLTGLLRR